MAQTAACAGVVIVDDDAVNRLGMAAILRQSDQVKMIATLDHDQAMTTTDLWHHTNVVIIDAADHRRPHDQFPGVAVAEHVRHHAPNLTIIAVTGHFFDDAVRRRMREARADFFYHRADMADPDKLRNAVLQPQTARRHIPGPHDPETQFRHGVTDHTHVNKAVAYALTTRLHDKLTQRTDPRSRRWLRLRTEFNRIAHLTPITGDGRLPDRPQQHPSLPQITRFLTWATKVKEPAPGND